MKYTNRCRHKFKRKNSLKCIFFHRTGKKAGLSLLECVNDFSACTLFIKRNPCGANVNKKLTQLTLCTVVNLRNYFRRKTLFILYLSAINVNVLHNNIVQHRYSKFSGFIMTTLLSALPIGRGYFPSLLFSSPVSDLYLSLNLCKNNIPRRLCAHACRVQAFWICNEYECD